MALWAITLCNMKITFSCDVNPYSLVVRYRRFGGMWFYPEDGRCCVTQNVGTA